MTTQGEKTDHVLALVTQDRGLEKVMGRVSNLFGSDFAVYENCADFVKDFRSHKRGVVIVDACICSQARLMDLQMVLNEARTWQVIYLPRTGKKQEVKEAMGLGVFGCLHKPVSEQEIQQMLESAMGMGI